MRIILTAIAFTLLPGGVFSQTFQATLKNGSEPNRAIVAFKPSSGFNSAPTNLQFTVAVPQSVGVRPTMNIISNNFSSSFAVNGIATFQTASYLTDYVYLINMSPSAFVYKDFIANQEEVVMELEFVGNVDYGTNIRLVQIPNGVATAGAGGENTLYNYYVEFSGFDRTNQIEMFYPTNGAMVLNSPLGYTGFSFVQRGGAIVPLTWVDFNAARTNMHGSLTWQVANQMNNNHFDIEVSKDGRTFNYLAKVPATSSNIYQYTHEFIDRWNVPSLYYRIKQVDKDGAFSYSVTKKLQLNGKALSLTLGQNPIKGSDVRAFIHATDAGKGTLMVTDLSGKVLYQKQTSWTAGTNNHTINMSAFASGGYILSLITDEEKVQVKFVK